MNERVSAIAPYLERIADSLNQRTIFALIALGGLLGLVLVFRLSDASLAAQERRAVLAERLMQQGGKVDEELWRERAEAAQTSLAQWRATRWTGETPGLVAAIMQSEISGIATAAEISVLALEVDPSPVDLPNGAALRFRLAAESPGGDSAARALAGFSAHRPTLIVDEVNAVFDEDEKSGRLSVSGYAPVVIAPTPNGEPG